MLTRTLRLLETVATWLEKLSLGGAIFLLLAMFGIMLSSIIARYVAHHPIVWSEELLTFFMSYSIFVVLGAATRADQHIRIGVFLEKLVGPARARRLSRTLENVIGLGVTGFFAYTAYRWTAFSYTVGEREFTRFMQDTYPAWTTKVLPTVGICLLAFFYFERCARQALSYVSSRRQREPAKRGGFPHSVLPESE